MLAFLLGLAVPALRAAAQAQPAPAAAAPATVPAIGVRGGEHGTFSRIVFDWPAPVAYQASRTGDTVTVTFAAPGTARLSGVSPNALSQLRGIRQISTGGNLVVALDVAPGAAVQHLIAGNRVVIDVLAPGNSAAAARGATVLPPGGPGEAAGGSAGAITPPAAPGSATPPAPAGSNGDNPAGSGGVPAPGATGAGSIMAPAPPSSGPPRPLIPPSSSGEPESGSGEGTPASGAGQIRGSWAPTPPPGSTPATGTEAPATGETAPTGPESHRAPLPRERPTPPPEPQPGSVAPAGGTGSGAGETTAPEAAPTSPAPAPPGAIGIPPVPPAPTPPPPHGTAAPPAGQAAPPQAAATPPGPAPSLPEVTPPALPRPPAPAAAPGPMAVPAPTSRQATFDPGQPSGAVVFQRAGALWVVFAASTRLDASALAAQGTPAFGVSEVIPTVGNSAALRFTYAFGERPSVTRTGTAWTVTLSREPDAPAEVLTVEPQPDFPLGSRVLVPAHGASFGTVRLADPTVGDELLAVPLSAAGAAMIEEHRYAQFVLMRTAQGVVTDPTADEVTMRPVDGGVEVTAPGGLAMSSANDQARSSSTGPGVSLDMAVWQGPPSQFDGRRQALQRAAAMADDAERERARLDLARFYVANGLGPEALSVLRNIERAEPGVVDRPDYALLRGAARVLSNDREGAAADLGRPALADAPEAALWRGAAAATAGDWPVAAREFGRAGDLLYAYPPPLRDRFGLWGAEAWLRRGDTDRAARDLDRLDQATGGESESRAEVAWLRGEVAHDRGEFDAAAAAWQRAVDSRDRLYHRLAAVALVDQDHERGTVTPAERVERMEALRYSWRGDDLEFEVLRRLGDAYWDNGNHRGAIETWQEAIAHFPEAASRQGLMNVVRDRLVTLFTGAELDQLSPIAALTLFQDNQGHIPVGPDRDRMVEHLAERLARADLFGSAGDLLQTLVEHRLTGGERVRVGARLAALRLLDGQPQAALTALDASRQEGDAAEPPERRLLRARTLAELGQPAAALDLLQYDQSRLADAARLDIAWRTQDWSLAAAMLGNLAGDPPAEGHPIEAGQRRLVLNRGIALALAGDHDGLAQLATRFGPAMASSPDAQVFALLTRPNATLDAGVGLSQVRQQVAEVDVFRDFLAGYRDGRPPLTH